MAPHMADTGGRALTLQPLPASVQDHDGAGPVLPLAIASPITIEIVREPNGPVGFAAHARRWFVARFFASINRNRRLAKDVRQPSSQPKPSSTPPPSCSSSANSLDDCPKSMQPAVFTVLRAFSDPKNANLRSHRSFRTI